MNKGVPFIQMAIMLDIQAHPFLISFGHFIEILPKINLHAKLLGRMKFDCDEELS